MDNVIDAADFASKQSDRWLFIAAILIILSGCWFLIRYFMREFEKERQLAREARREDQREFLLALANRDTAMAALAKEVREVSELLRQHHEAMVMQHTVDINRIIELAIDNYRRTQ
jgi:ABC-type nickel/cobalt efflux system permease component RcnA